MIWILLATFALFTGVDGLYESIDDITNNLATDLAPLITLFGEQATKQFLSESTSFMDSIIFSIAPLGLITAVVSVIRIYGSSSFKSIIGRSQEAHGVAEAELCSSTSQDVCELWSNGGICRVFGRPRILHFIHNVCHEKDFYPSYKEDRRGDIVEEQPCCGIYPANELFGNDEKSKNTLYRLGWKEVSPNGRNWLNLLSRLLGTKHNDRKTKSEPSANPNLTLNIGIRKIDRRIHWSALAFSVLLQLSFFGYATWATFYDPSILNDGAPSPQTKVWFGLTIIGTSILVSGMILCARLIDLKSRERRFKNEIGASQMFWLQPGSQRVGDQLFQAFAYSESPDEYVTSERVENVKRERTLFLAVIFTVSGWVLQFVGLRGSPGSIALFQFIATLVMSFLRAFLRGKRLEADKNRLGHEYYRRSNLIEGHELDWQAMNIDEDDRHHEWRISDHVPNEHQDDVKTVGRREVVVMSTKRFSAYYTSGCITQAANYASDWIAAKESIDSACINSAAKIMRFRMQLAKLTSVQSGLPAEQAWSGEIRTTALQLQKAMQVSVEYIFAKFPLVPLAKLRLAKLRLEKLRLAKFPLDGAFESRPAPKAIAWTSSCWFSKITDQTSQEEDLQGVQLQGAEGHLLPVGFQMYNRDGKWTMSSNQLEAVLGLWSWSLKQSEPFLGPTAEEYLTRSKLVVVEKSNRHEMEDALCRWVTQTRQIRRYSGVRGISRTDNLSMPMSNVLGRDEPRQTDLPNTAEFTTLSIPTNGSTSLLQLMAQDVYTVFINRILDIVGELSPGDPEDYLTLSDHSFSTTSLATPLLTNPHIDALANALVTAGVATREEALMSIVPAFLCKKKLPVLDEDMVQKLLDRAKSLRRDLKFREGAALIIRMLSSCPARFHKQGLRCLGDLYRRAARSRKTSDQRFGLIGMRDLKVCYYDASASDVQDQEMLQCYDRLYGVFTSGKPLKVEYDDSYVITVVEDKQEDFERALTLSERFYLRSQSVVSRILEWALKKDFPELIKDLWMSGCAPQLRQQESPLLFASAQECELETFHSLLDWPGTDVDAKVQESERGDHFDTPLICAINKYRTDVVCSILRRGADVHQRDSRPGLDMTPLHHASQSSNMAIIQLLLEKGADIHERAATGQTALHFAAKANDEAVTRFLIKKGAEVDEKDEKGRTPLHHAAKASDKAVILSLLRNRAKIHERDRKGRTPLHHAAKANGEIAIAFLLRNGAQIHGRDNEGRTPLHHAVSKANSKAVIQFLLENSAAPVNEKDGKGRTPLHFAVAQRDRKNGKEITRLLLEKGAGTHEKDEDGQTSLHFAALDSECEGLARLLLEKGADIREEDNEGQTALHVAAEKGSLKILRLLLEKSAENGSVSDHDWSSLWSVIREDDQKTAQLLEEKGISKPSKVEGKDGDGQEAEEEETEE